MISAPPMFAGRLSYGAEPPAPASVPYSGSSAKAPASGISFTPPPGARPHSAKRARPAAEEHEEDLDIRKMMVDMQKLALKMLLPGSLVGLPLQAVRPPSRLLGVRLHPLVVLLMLAGRGEGNRVRCVVKLSN